jgi:hypothetical protein
MCVLFTLFLDAMARFLDAMARAWLWCLKNLSREPVLSLCYQKTAYHNLKFCITLAYHKVS